MLIDGDAEFCGVRSKQVQTQPSRSSYGSIVLELSVSPSGKVKCFMSQEVIVPLPSDAE